MRSKRGLWVALILTFVVGFVVTLPARVIYSMLDAPQLSVSGISGTLWSGSANEALINGVFLRNIEWQSRPWHLLSGSMTFAVKADPPSGFIEGTAAVGFGGNITLSDLTASLPLAVFSESLGIGGLRGNGQFRFDRVSFDEGVPVAADGVIEIADLRVPLLDRGPLGDYRAEFSTQDDGISASIEDSPGVVDLAARLKLDPDRRFEFLGFVVANSETPKSVQERLKFLPPPNERGQREIRLEGTY